MSINIIACVNEDFAIGNSVKNDLLYKIKDDLIRFRGLTLNNFTVYGRSTYLSLPKPFDKRVNVILTRNKKFTIDDEILNRYEIIIANDLYKVINNYKFSGKQEKDVYLCGGVEIFAEGIHYADKIHLTMVHDCNHPDADVFFPKQELSEFKVVKREKKFDEESGLSYSFIDYERKLKEEN